MSNPVIYLGRNGGCASSENMTVCYSNFDMMTKRRRKCPICKKVTTHVGFHQAWYGWNITCLSCGDEWTDGELHPRPFAPGWRKKNIEHAKRTYKSLLKFQISESEGRKRMHEEIFGPEVKSETAP